MAEALTDEDTGQPPSPAVRKRGMFIRGPFDQAQFCLAARLGRGPLVVWQLVHHLIRLTHRQEVAVPNGLLAACGIDRFAKTRALVQLERLGLISITRAKGRAPRISLVKLPDGGSA
jgi:hypothetical protein